MGEGAWITVHMAGCCLVNKIGLSTREVARGHVFMFLARLAGLIRRLWLDYDVTGLNLYWVRTQVACLPAGT